MICPVCAQTVVMILKSISLYCTGLKGSHVGNAVESVAGAGLTMSANAMKKIKNCVVEHCSCKHREES